MKPNIERERERDHNSEITVIETRERNPINRNNSNNKNKTKHATKHNNTPQTATETEAKALFDILPFLNENLTQEEEDQPYACINYIPGIAPQLKRAFTKAGANVTFTSSAKLKDILCSQNKTHAPKEKKRESTNTHAHAPTKQYISAKRIALAKFGGKNMREQ